jgi:hypothetical protein
MYTEDFYFFRERNGEQEEEKKEKRQTADQLVGQFLVEEQSPAEP